ncbi:MAG: LD-carboxypeptidase [Planctomycetes bacterium]|nr:LD-carboxypeptidase [Planctomycetota bacterium]
MTMRIRPPSLRPRDLVAVVAPSAAPPYDDLIQKGVEFLEAEGLRVRLGESVLKHRGYIGRDRALRARDLERQFADRRVKGIFCLVGGFSAFELLDLLDYARIARSPKIFLGFSDNTSLLNAVHERTGLVTFMGENVLWGLSERRERSREQFARALFDPRPLGRLEGGTEAWRDGPPRSGRTVAGNLWTLVSLAGTPFAPRYRGRVLFWEDVRINVDDVNCALWHLRLAGAFRGLTGMVAGHLEGVDEEEFGLTVRDALLRVSEGEAWPILKTEAFGHRVPSAVIPIGVRARIGGGEVVLEESGVEAR